MYTIEFSKLAEKKFNRLDKSIKRIIKKLKKYGRQINLGAFLSR